MIKVQKMSVASASLFAVGAVSLSSLCPAQAVVLTQKFQAGQSANYDVALNGTVQLNASDQTPVPWAGMPLSVPVVGSGQVAFDTLTTDSNGGGTIRTRVPIAKMTGSAFGMNAVVTENNGVGSFSLNGAPGKTFPLPMLVNPTYAINLSRLGRIQGVTAIPSSTATATATATAKNAVSSTRSVPRIIEVADDGASMLQKWLDVMPDVWPNRDLQIGDTWSVESKMPLANAPGGFLNLGSMNFKLVGQETVSGVTLQHLALNGTFAIDAAKAAILNAAKPKSDASKGTAQIVSDSKTLTGDLWFDANAGRVARAALKIAATNTMSGTTKPDAQGATHAWTSTQGFAGTFGMQLNNVAATPVKTANQARTAQSAL